MKRAKAYVGQRVEQHGLHPGRGAVNQRTNVGATVVAIHRTRAEVEFDGWVGTYRVHFDYLRPERVSASTEGTK